MSERKLRMHVGITMPHCSSKVSAVVTFELNGIWRALPESKRFYCKGGERVVEMIPNTLRTSSSIGCEGCKKFILPKKN